jgi:hypothetical protein
MQPWAAISLPSCRASFIARAAIGPDALPITPTVKRIPGARGLVLS